jgi:hypothetical protein
MTEVFSSYDIRGRSKIQNYPQETQKNYNSFSSRNIMIGNGKELEFPEGRGGLESASRILMKGSGIRFTDSDDREVPPTKIDLPKKTYKTTRNENKSNKEVSKPISISTSTYDLSGIISSTPPSGYFLENLMGRMESYHSSIYDSSAIHS